MPKAKLGANEEGTILIVALLHAREQLRNAFSDHALQLYTCFRFSLMIHFEFDVSMERL